MCNCNSFIGKRFFEHHSKNPLQLDSDWLNSSSESIIKKAIELKSAVNKISEGKNTWSQSAIVHSSEDNLHLLKVCIILILKNRRL